MKLFLKFGTVFLIFLSVLLSGLFHLLSTNIDAILWLDELIDSYSNASDFNTLHNTFLQGNYAPVENEHNNLPLIPLSGQIPNDISGLFIRIGPNPIPSHVGRKKLHKFDGHGMIHSIRIKEEGGRDGDSVLYSNQYIQTPRYLLEKKYNKTIFFNSGELKGIVGIFKMLLLMPLKLKYFGLTDVTSGPANMNVVVLGSRIYACHEGSLPFAIHWNANNTFESVGYELNNHHPSPSSSFTPPHSSNSLSLPMTSHPKVDIKTQTMYFTGFSSGMDVKKPSAMYGSAYGTHSLQIIDNTEVLLSSRPWIHDMMITEHYLLLLSGSIVTNSESSNIPTGKFLTFDKQMKFEIGVASKDDAEFVVGGSHAKQIDKDLSKSLQWFRALDSAAIMHVGNAWEEVNSQNHTIIILWAPICTHTFDGTFLKNENKFYLSRVALNLKTGQMRKGTLGTEYNIDYPVVHPAYQGYQSKFMFASILDNSLDTNKNNNKSASDNEPIGIIKFNLFDKIIEQTIYFTSGVFSGEMVPLPKSNSKIQKNTKDSDGSDAVYLASFFFNSNSNTSEWHVFDGETMNSIPVATFSVPVNVPYGSHGEWIKEEVLQSIIQDF
jgi:carotenoid cleavage dioxygenase-like enzyme